MKNAYIPATLMRSRGSCVVLLIKCQKRRFWSASAKGTLTVPRKGFSKQVKAVRRGPCLQLSKHLLLRSKFLAPAVICVVIFVSILTVWRLLVSREIITLCH